MSSISRTFNVVSSNSNELIAMCGLSEKNLQGGELKFSISSSYSKPSYVGEPNGIIVSTSLYYEVSLGNGVVKQLGVPYNDLHKGWLYDFEGRISKKKLSGALEDLLSVISYKFSNYEVKLVDNNTIQIEPK